MSAVVCYDDFGDPSVLRLADEDVPTPGPHQVLIANRAVGVNPADVKQLAGGFSRQDRLPGVLGFEAAGVIEEIGEDVTGFWPGDAVLWHGAGAQRERAIVHIDRVRRKPAAVDFEQAAVLPIAAATAYSALSQLGIGPRDGVLIQGASGGVGSAAVQIAVAMGARVIGTASPRNAEYVRWLGAVPVPYGPGLIDHVLALPDGLNDVTAALDLVGSRETVAAMVALIDSETDPTGLQGPHRRAVTVVGSEQSQAAGITEKRDHPGALDEVISLADTGLLHLNIAARFPLPRAHEALALVAGRHVRGKVVLVL